MDCGTENSGTLGELTRLGEGGTVMTGVATAKGGAGGFASNSCASRSRFHSSTPLALASLTACSVNRLLVPLGLHHGFHPVFADHQVRAPIALIGRERHLVAQPLEPGMEVPLEGAPVHLVYLCQ